MAVMAILDPNPFSFAKLPVQRAERQIPTKGSPSPYCSDPRSTNISGTEVRCSFPHPRSNSSPFQGTEEKLNPLPAPATMPFAPLFSPSGAGSVKATIPA